jgi:hypothetical protein
LNSNGFAIRPPTSIRALTLVEVVLSLAVFIFAGFALISLLGVGLAGNRDSKEMMQAANIAESICATRRATPMLTTTTGFPLPALYPSSSNLTSPTLLTQDGVTTTVLSNARFGLLYNIVSSPNYVAGVKPGMATVYLSLYWPAQASPNSAAGHFDLTTSFALP